MSLKELEAMGAFVKDEPIRREIKFKLDDDIEHSAIIHVKKLSVGAYEKLFVGIVDDKNGRSARVISETITLGEIGKERIPVEKAFTLNKGIATAMLDAFTEVNGGKPKNSRPPISSSTT